MRKVPTIFDRDWSGNSGVIEKLIVHPGAAIATEKINGTNVRVTIRTDAQEPGGPSSFAVPVRLEKRRNPSREQKADGITEPWYVDARRDDPADQYLFQALAATPLLDIPEGEWSAEATGPKIQGNPLKLDQHRLLFFDLDRLPGELCVPVLVDCPSLIYPVVGDLDVKLFFDALQSYLDTTHSQVNPEVGIEGVVWHGGDGWAKIKRADFKDR